MSEKPHDAPFVIGTYQLGWRNIEVFADPTERGGAFYFAPEPGKLSRIRVGMDYAEIRDAWSVLQHEALEMLMADHGARYLKSGSFCAGASDAYSFYFDHNQLTEIAAKLGHFTFDVHDDFSAAWALVHV